MLITDITLSRRICMRSASIYSPLAAGGSTVSSSRCRDHIPSLLSPKWLGAGMGWGHTRGLRGIMSDDRSGQKPPGISSQRREGIKLKHEARGERRTHGGLS
jgi:hypothetical protein